MGLISHQARVDQHGRVAWPDVVGPDPVDVRLLTAVADTGRAAVHELAARLGMDVREVAARLAALSTTGLPLMVSVECDAQGIRNALAAANAWASQHNSGAYQVPNSGGYPVQTPQSGGHPVQTPNTGGYPAHPPHTGGYPAQAHGYPPHTTPSGPYPSGPSGSYPPHPAPPPAYPPPMPPAGPAQQDAMNTWGPPGSASWARGDQAQPTPAQETPAPAAVTGKIGSTLDVTATQGEQITIQLVEVVDPADFLFTAAGYQLKAGDRAVVVHTELTNRGTASFDEQPDRNLVLVATDGSTVSKAPVSLSSRPPHRAGVPPEETVGGHTVYVLPDSTQLSAVRWTSDSGDNHTLTWDITDL